VVLANESTNRHEQQSHDSRVDAGVNSRNHDASERRHFH